MRAYFFLSAVALLVMTYPSHADEEEVLEVKLYQSHERYQFGVELLKLALNRSGRDYFLNIPESQRVNEARGHAQVVSGAVDVQFLKTNTEFETSTIPIKVPIYRGISGLRLLLVRKDDKEKFKSLSTIDGLRKLTGGHGIHWPDLPVYAANELPVETNVSYEGLFIQLKHSRFDYFHRGINEIWDELEIHEDELVVEEGVLLFYEHPTYFFVTKSKPELAELIEGGLIRALEDGSFKKLFLSFHGDMIKKANLAGRNLIRLKNPSYPEDQPKIDTSWWLPEKFNKAYN